MNLPDDIDLTEDMDFSYDETISVYKRNVPSKDLPWEKEFITYINTHNTIWVQNRNQSFPITNNVSDIVNAYNSENNFRIIFTTSGDRLVTPNSIGTMSITTPDSKNTIWYNIDDTITHFSINQDWCRIKKLTKEEIELITIYENMPCSRDLYKTVLVSIDPFELEILPSVIKTEIEELSSPFEDVLFSDPDDILCLYPNIFIQRGQIRNSTISWQGPRIWRDPEDEKENPYNKSIPWEE